jgi:hypothetical protein
MATLNITTVPAATVPVGKIQVTVRARAGKDKNGNKTEITAANRSRSVLIDEFRPAVSNKYLNIVCAALYDTAKQQLDAQWSADANIKDTESTLYTEDALLAYAARESESKKLTGDAIVLWWNQSELKKSLVAAGKYSDKQLGALVEQLKNIAAPTPDYNEEKALKRIATLGMHEADLDHDVCVAMIAKLQRIIDKIKAERDKIGDVAELDL